jgi:hypothetical protein
MEDVVGAMWERGIGEAWLVPHPDGVAMVRPAPSDALLDELLLDETVFTSRKVRLGADRGGGILD